MAFPAGSHVRLWRTLRPGSTWWISSLKSDLGRREWYGDWWSRLCSCGISPGMDEGWIIPELPDLYSVPCQAVLVQAASVDSLPEQRWQPDWPLRCAVKGAWSLFCLLPSGGSWRGCAWGRTGSQLWRSSSSGRIGKAGPGLGKNPGSRPTPSIEGTTLVGEQATLGGCCWEQWRPTWTTSLLCAGYAGCRPGITVTLAKPCCRACDLCQTPELETDQ